MCVSWSHLDHAPCCFIWSIDEFISRGPAAKPCQALRALQKRPRNLQNLPVVVPADLCKLLCSSTLAFSRENDLSNHAGKSPWSVKAISKGTQGVRPGSRTSDDLVSAVSSVAWKQEGEDD